MGVLAPGVPVASRPSGTPPLRHRTLNRIDFLKFSCIREAPRAVLIDKLCTLGVNICALESTDRDVALTLRRVVFHNSRPVGWLPFSSCRLLCCESRRAGGFHAEEFSASGASSSDHVATSGRI